MKQDAMKNTQVNAVSTTGPFLISNSNTSKGAKQGLEKTQQQKYSPKVLIFFVVRVLGYIVNRGIWMTIVENPDANIDFRSLIQNS